MIKVEKVKDNLLVSFDYDAALVDKIKSLPTRKYIADMKAWQIPQWEIKDLIELFGDDLNISNDVDVNKHGYLKSHVAGAMNAIVFLKPSHSPHQ